MPLADVAHAYNIFIKEEENCVKVLLKPQERFIIEEYQLIEKFWHSEPILAIAGSVKYNAEDKHKSVHY